MLKQLFVLLIIFICQPVSAGQIVATVNDEPISSYDVDARVKLIAVQRAEYLNNKRKAQYVKEALDLIIDEKVKMIEAQKYGFTINDSDIAQAVAHLEKQNNLKPGEMKTMLAKNGIPISVLENQLKTDLLWLQVIQKQTNQSVTASSAEIEKKKNELRAKLRAEEFYVFEILVSGKQDAEKCYNELRNGKAFDVVATQYSQAPSKNNGGEVGWIKADHYSKAITSVLRQLNPGDLSAPLKTPKGYLLLLLQDKKTPVYTDFITLWELAQMAMPTEQAVQFEKELINLKSCESFMTFAKEHAIPESVKSGLVAPDQLPTELKEILSKEPLKTAIGPVRTKDADVFFMKCALQSKQILPPDDIIKAQIENDKMEALSDKLLRNAKRFVVIERK